MEQVACRVRPKRKKFKASEVITSGVHTLRSLCVSVRLSVGRKGRHHDGQYEASLQADARPLSSCSLAHFSSLTPAQALVPVCVRVWCGE